MKDERGPPPVANSRFAAAAEADRSYPRDDRGPPPVANSRFAAAAEADRSPRNEDYEDRGPPPVANSRFAAAAEADRSHRRDDGFGLDDRGPPPVANSRFAAAAAMAEEEEGRFRQERNDGFGRNDGPRGPPIPQNSRFADAVASDPDYVDRELRERQDDRGGDRFRGRDDYDDRGGHGGNDGYGRRGGYQDGSGYGGRYDKYDEPGLPMREESKSSVADLLKPKARPVEENILKVPTKDQSENILKVDNVLKPPSKETKVETPAPAESTPAPIPVAPAPTAAPAVDTKPILDEFVSGKRQGDDLAAWIKEQPALPTVKSLVFHMLTETEKLNPDVECGWAEPSKYGSALVSLVHDDVLKQMDVLFGIQEYCDKLGMPKLNDEYVIQAMFRSMYKYDLADDEAFAMWKDDESPEHEGGKLKAVIQTVDWFNWLEEDDEDGEEEYEE
jgi:eIF4-gamma/eIF5/eIF2-epsilon